MATNIIVYAIPGSQFVFKVLAAIQSRNIPHYVHLVPLDAKKRVKVIPSGGLLVPEIQVGLTKEDRIIVSDSEKILHWFDENMNTNFFPSGTAASELSDRASSKTLASMVWYYNWVNQTGYEKSMQKSFAKSALPGWIFFFRTTIVDSATKEFRRKFRAQVQQSLELSEADLDDEPKMRDKLIEELKYFQSLLKSDDQVYMLESATEGETQQATAVDFSVYAQIERLVGDAGVASDVEIFPALPELIDNPDLSRLWKWHQNMQSTFKVQFRDKRVPPEVMKALGLS